MNTKKMSISIDITDEEYEALKDIALDYDTTVNRLLSQFIADITCSERSGGSDERDYAGLCLLCDYSWISTMNTKKMRISIDLTDEEYEKLKDIALDYDATVNCLLSQFIADLTCSDRLIDRDEYYAYLWLNRSCYNF